MAEITRDTIIEAARKAAGEIGEALTREDFVRLSGISLHHLYRHFPEGGWSEVRQLVGLGRHPSDYESVTDTELLHEFHRLATELGRIPTQALFDARSKFSRSTLQRRFGGLPGVLKHYRLWLEEHHPESFLLQQLEAKSKHEIPAPPVLTGDIGAQPRATWAKVGGPEFGPPINFRGLRHAPINEQGVVFLFGMVSYELGFIVEAVHASYPDCEAKRCVDRRNQRWQRVRIEFEFKSSTFNDHGHDPSACDVIVCWEHDWAECPIEVVELRKVIDELEA